MALESANWITQLVQANPVDGDPVGEGDDHLRMIKTVLKNSFPSSSTTAVIPNVSGQSGKYLTTDGTDTSWGEVNAGATGGGSDEIFWENGQNVTTNYTVSASTNSMSAGPITINSGVTVTVPSGSSWMVI